MGRARRKAKEPSGPLQRLIDKAANEEAGAPLVSPFAEQHGDYVPAAKTGEMRKAMRNNGGTTLDRWNRDGAFSDSQLAAILHVQRLWRLTDSSARLVANLDRTVFGSPGDGNLAEIEARTDLHRIIDYFPYPLDVYWHVFEGVCRFDQPAGAAGSALATCKRSSMDAAKLVVRFVADTIYMKERLSY